MSIGVRTGPLENTKNKKYGKLVFLSFLPETENCIYIETFRFPHGHARGKG